MKRSENQSGLEQGGGEFAATDAAGLGSRLGGSYARYTRSLQEAWNLDDVRQRSQAAYLTYLKTLFDSGGDPVRQLEAYVNYGRELDDAYLPAETRERVGAALRQYVDEVLSAVGRMDLERLDGAALCTAAQHLYLAGLSAAASEPYLPR